MTTETPTKKKFEFPGAVTVLTIVMILVWVMALFLPSGTFATDADGAPIPGTFTEVPSPLSWGERVQQLILAPVNGLYGTQDLFTGFVDPDNLGRLSVRSVSCCSSWPSARSSRSASPPAALRWPSVDSARACTTRVGCSSP
ncbi:hypothetical protein [Nocardia camponoti]|uniref:YfcC family protein n=1 Tax=Nocardia camponoti TaxID=1616106 RepID=A0A917Q9F8_9NOCA|nr:hypothetical protein [Nocardia camponoti]GGK37502.1 hypothetical protein GCM10011591_06410 [Nocardia camponoti]